MTREELQSALAEWINTNVIADKIIDTMEEENIELTFDNGYEIWLNHLEELHRYL